jgi:uncharacterized protein DUF3574
MRLAFALLILPALAGCVAVQPLACAGTARPRLVAELIFGRNIGARLGVSEAAWRRFLDEEVTPRFPGGFTVLDSSGQWGEGPRRAPRRARAARNSPPCAPQWLPPKLCAP